MAIYVYDSTSGALRSYCPADSDPVADAATLAAKGLAVAKGLPALDATHAWDATTRAVVVVAATPTPAPIATGKWILRFTALEFQAINASPDAQVQQFMYALNHTTQIDLADPVVVNGVKYLVSLNLLASARVAVVMASP